MRSLSLPLVAVIASLSVSSAFALDMSVTSSGTNVSMSGASLSVTSTGVSANMGDVNVTMNAPSSVAPAAGSSLGEYKSVACASNSLFGVNSCDQCFDGGGVKVGTRMTGIFDNWTNSSTSILEAYKDEQKTPNMVKVGNSTWSTTPANEAGVWKYSSDVVWVSTGSGGRANFTLSPNTKVRFFEADLGAGYTLDKTDKKNGEVVGLLRFPLVSRSVNLQTAAEGAAVTRYECVAYKLDAPVVQPAQQPATPEKPATPPKEATKTETGPETLLLIAAAFFIAFGLMMTLRKRA